MSDSRQTAAAYRFPGWELRPRERVLLVRGEPAKIGGRAFDVLLALVEREGRVVGKGELLDVAWPGLVVEENNLSVQITGLRKLLGAQSIATVAGIGYRLAERSQSVAAGPVDDVRAASARTTLIGRDADLEALGKRLGVDPLITIVGTGGVGKTSLAKVAIARSQRSWRDGCHWIDLAPLREQSSLAPLVAKTLSIALQAHDQEPLDFIASLSRLEALIVVDNCEHRLDEVAAFIGPALQLAPGIRWLATSQEPLHLAAESVHRLGPLDLPPEGADAAVARRSGALALLVERARAADLSFELGDERLDAALEICMQLDGLPLAIEMAAARVATLGLHGVRDQLTQRLRLRAGPRAAPPRQHTLLQTYEWSYGLLTPVEQRVFRRLGVFSGGFDTGLVQGVCCRFERVQPMREWEVLDSLSALVDKSLVHHSGDRFSLLQSARDYACLRLLEEGEDTAVRRSHAESVVERFESVHDDFETLRDSEWIARYVPERHNVSTALGWAKQAREADTMAKLVAALAKIDVASQTQASVVQYEVPLDVLEAASQPWRAHAHLELGWAHYLDGSRETGTRLVEQALADFDAIGDLPGTYVALARLVRLCESRPGLAERGRELNERLQQIDVDRLPLKTRLNCKISAGLQYRGRNIAGVQELHDIAQRAGFDALAAVCRTVVTDELLIQCRFEEVAETCKAVLAQGESRSRARSFLYHNQALALVQLGRIEEAKVAARAVLRAMPSGAHMIVDLFALVAAREQRFVDAALMAGHAEQVKRERDLSTDPAEASVVSETLNRLHEALGPERLSELMKAGAAMPAERVLALALPD